MSAERSFEAWEEVQRQGLDLADRLAQGFTGLIQSHITQPPAFPWPTPPQSKLFDLEFPGYNFSKIDFGVLTSNPGVFGVLTNNPGVDGVSAILDIGSRIGQAGADFGSGLNGLIQQFFTSFPVPFKLEEVKTGVGLTAEGTERFNDFGFVENGGAAVVDGLTAEPTAGFNLNSAAHLGKPQGVVNITSTFDSRNQNIESSLAARGDLWRVEASNSSSTSGNDNSLFLIQLGPLLFVRDSTLLLPVHLSQQHLLWYGYDRKNGMHSLCPAVWSKHRRWLLMSMLGLNPLACSFVDLQFPNGQFTYVAGEGLTTSAFLPLYGGLLQAQGQYPGEMRFSFSHKNKWGTRITPMIQWPDRSFTLGLSQALVWQRSGLMVRPTVQLSVCPTFGGSNPGWRAELIHSVNDQLNLICGCGFTAHPSVFASLSYGRSKWNGNVGRSGIVVRVDSPLSHVGSPSVSVQLNSGIEF